MIIRTHDNAFAHATPSDITPHAVYQGRRTLIRGMAGGLAGAALMHWAARDAMAQSARPGKLAALPGARSGVAGALTMEKRTDYKDASTYNNFYEFGTDKSDPAENAHSLKSTPWTVEIEGLVKKPQKIALEDLLKLGAQEERVYRLRCVEGWSMVIPWVGYSLSELIRRVEPTGNAKYIEFYTLADRAQSPASARDLLPILAPRLPQVRVQVLPGLGHMAPVTHPERVNPLIVDFLQRQTMLGS